MSADLTAMQDRINSKLSQINSESIRVRLYTGPVGTLPSGNMTGFTEVSGTGYTRASDIEWTQVEGITVTHFAWPPVDEDDPYELDMTDATPTGIGDPLADVLRSIDEVLEGQ